MAGFIGTLLDTLGCASRQLRACQAAPVSPDDRDTVWYAAFSPDGRRIVTSSADSTARLWDSDGKQLAVLAGHTDTVCSAAFSPDGRRIGTASADSTVRLWDSDGNPIAVLAGHRMSVWSVEFSLDSKRILTTSADGTARQWSSDGKPLAVLATERVLYAAFSPDGSRNATIPEESKDHTVRLWDNEWQEIAVLAGHTDAVSSVAFSPDGRRIATASQDHTAPCGMAKARSSPYSSTTRRRSGGSCSAPMGGSWSLLRTTRAGACGTARERCSA